MFLGSRLFVKSDSNIPDNRRGKESNWNKVEARARGWEEVGNGNRTIPAKGKIKGLN